MGMFDFLKPKGGVIPCDHRYCYRDIHCTRCNKPFPGPGEPNYTPHIPDNNGRMIPAVEINGALVPEDATQDMPEPVKCTYCGGTKFFEGPSGGASTNILCANPDCRHWFNYHGGILPMDDLHRVEPAPEEKAKQADAAQLEQDRQFAERINIGAVDYREHGSIAILRQRQLADRMTYPKPEQIDEICGFIMGMSDEIKSLREKIAEHELKVSKTVHFIGELEDKEMLELTNGGGEHLGHVQALPAYGPGSITDYTPEAFAEAAQDLAAVFQFEEKVTLVQNNPVLKMFAEFCSYMDGHAGHPADLFKEWLKEQGIPLSDETNRLFNEFYMRE